jgi:hypothetical protein
MVLIDGRYSYAPRHHDVGLIARIPDLVDALPWGESLELDLCGQYSSFLLIEQRK